MIIWSYWRLIRKEKFNCNGVQSEYKEFKQIIRKYLKHFYHSFEIWSGLTVQFRTWPIQSWNRVELKKIEKEEHGWPGDSIKNLVATCWLLFLLKQRRFDFKKNWPWRPGDPIKTRNPGLELDRFWKLWFSFKKMENKLFPNCILNV